MNTEQQVWLAAYCAALTGISSLKDRATAKSTVTAEACAEAAKLAVAEFRKQASTLR